MTNYRCFHIAAVLAAGLSFGIAIPGQAQSDAAGRCQALAQTDFSGVTDAPTQVTSTSFLVASNSDVASCLVEGYVTPTVGFKVHLPAQNWNGKFIKRGCGAYCGTTGGTAEGVWWDCTNHVNDGYACVVSDMGHRSTIGDAKWAYNNLQLKIDFAYRATHVATVAGKAITEAFYGNAPQRSYFMGCSTGGRQGMVEAQRFPWDFDGIIAGAPAINETGAGMRLVWTTAGNLDENRQQILTADKVLLLYNAALSKCDAYDGTEDGIIDDPRSCNFDPGVLRCAAGNSNDCLTEGQVAVARNIYSGPHTPDGKPLYTGGAMPGSELDWVGNYISMNGEPGRYYFMIGDMFRYMGFLPDPGPSWRPEDFDFGEDYKRLGMMEGLYSGSNPDLRKFRDAGGKLLVYHGWADSSAIPLNTIDYYELATKTMGGAEATKEFFRLFMIPGMSHCSGGLGAYAIDYLSHMEDWVEAGKTPDMMMGYHPKEQTDRFGTDFPLDPDMIEFSRSVYPYSAPISKGD